MIHQEGYLNSHIEVCVKHLGHTELSYKKRDEQEDLLRESGVWFRKRQARNIGGYMPAEVWIIRRADLNALKEVVSSSAILEINDI